MVNVMVEQTTGTISVGRDGVAEVTNVGCCADHATPAIGHGPCVSVNLIGRCGHDYQLALGFHHDKGLTDLVVCKSNKRDASDPVPGTLA
jgi:hypothetical protein